LQALSNRLRDGAEFEEHRQRLRPVTELASDRLQFEEAERPIEGDGVGLGIVHYADTTHIGRHPMGERKDGPQERFGNASALGAPIDGKPGQTQNGERVGRQAPAGRRRQALGGHFRRGDRGETQDRSAVVDCHVGRADMMAKLVLPGVAQEESVELDVAGLEPGPVVLRLQAPG
jgi:hypothetical protein